MKGKKILAGLLSALLMCSAAPITYAADSSSDSIFESGFEDGEGITEFTGRGGVEEIQAVTTQSHSGDYSMSISGRTKSWNGPQFLLDNRCEAGTEYIVSAWVKTEWYSTVNLSMEYTDSDGERHYSNLKSAISNASWEEIEETKFSFSDDVTNVYLYFESSDANVTMYVDDFVLKASPVKEVQQDIGALKDLTSSFKVGTAVTASELASQTRQSLIKKHFNSITLGNELKPDALLDREASIAAGNDNPQISLASARSILNFCRDNNISVRGHVLVWHSQTPDWFFKENYSDDGDWVDQETMLKRMENYIKNVFAAIEEEYPTVDFYAWDVVNECFLNDGSARNPGEQGSSGSDNSAWVQIFGDNSFIEYAFRFARQYAPEGCKLYYNDFNEYMPQKTAAIVEMATKLQAEGLIDGIGMQSHLDVSFPGVDVYKKALAAFAATGLDVQITELDVTTSDTSDAGLETQAKYYGQIMDAIMEYQDSISAVVFWGTTDDASWRSSRLPLLFDKEYDAKSSYFAVADSISNGTLIVEPTTQPETEATTAAATTEATTEAETETTTAETTDISTIIYGDVDENGTVEINDAVKIMSYVGNPTKYELSETALAAADVYNSGYGIDNMDALAVQKFCAQVVKSLPESFAE
jgi:endo-1,4-beta-xylanase